MNVTDSTEVQEDVLDALPFGVIMFEPVFENGTVADFEWRFMNRLASQLGMIDSGERLGKKLLEVAPDLADGPLFKALRAAVVEVKANRLEHFFSREASVTGKDCWYSVHTEPFRQGVLVTFEDITRQKRAEARIKQLVFRDELTGIHNRRYFVARTPELLSIARREAWTCALIYFDLDGFKSVNDRYGHHVGDQVLQGVAQRLSAVKREGDVFFRAGGDEFALFLPNAEKKAALATAERIAERLTAPFELDGAAHRIGVSIGVAVMLSEEASVEDLLSRADKAMYIAKARQDPQASTTVLWQPGLV
ncbi:hypothetical protein BH24DEI2_BH24DEI2_10690 [soil metagenome]